MSFSPERQDPEKFNFLLQQHAHRRGGDTATRFLPALSLLYFRTDTGQGMVGTTGLDKKGHKEAVANCPLYRVGCSYTFKKIIISEGLTCEMTEKLLHCLGDFFMGLNLSHTTMHS